MFVRGWGRAALAVGVVLVAVAFLSAAFALISEFKFAPFPGENAGVFQPGDNFTITDRKTVPSVDLERIGENDELICYLDENGLLHELRIPAENLAGLSENARENLISELVREQMREHSAASSALGDRVPVDGLPPHAPVFHITAPKTWFVRQSVGEVYGGGAWRVRGDSEVRDYSGEYITPDVEEYSSSLDWSARIMPLGSMRGFVPVPGHAVRVENLRGLQYFPLQRSFFSGSAFTSRYSVSYRIYEYSENLLRGAELDLSDLAYLQLPADVTGRTRQLAADITQGIENPYEKARAIEGYLRANYTYDRNYTRAPAGHDPVDWFLFEERRGHCMNFNSSFVVLARSVGIPARAVFGYAVDPSYGGVVYADDSHVNAEVKFEGLGWVPFNATAPHPGDAGDSDGDGMPDWWENWHGLNPNLSDANLDPDGDGYTNYEEYLAGTDPMDPASTPADSDNDGMPDWWERQHGLNPNVNDANQDADGDGYTNVQEYRMGTDPRDPASRPSEVGPIPTTTEITEMDGTSVKGGTFGVRGRVVDRYGSGVSGAYVTVYMKKNKAEDAPEVGSGWTENGWFDITCEVSRDIEVGDYHVVARSWGTATHDGSWSDPMIRIVSETAISLSAPGRAMTGVEFSVSGRLVEKTTGAAVGSQEVAVVLGALVQRKQTGGDGSFTAKFSLPTPDNYSLTASFAGSGYYLSSTSDRAVEVVQPYVLPSTSDRLARGERAAISGTVPIGGLAVRISLDNISVETTSTGDGSFAAEVTIPASRPPGAATVTYTLPAVPFSMSQEVAVCAKTFIGLDAPENAEPGKELGITANLKDDLGAPVQDAWLTLGYAEGSLRAKTDASGTAAFHFTAPSEPRSLEFAVSFEGSGPYLSSENAGVVALVAPAGPGPSVPIVLLVAAVVIPTVTAVALVLRRRKKKPKAEPAEVKKVQKLAARGGLSLGIEFPHVKEPFPDVWGAGEPMRVSVRLERGEKPAGGAALRVAIDGRREEVRTTASGEWSTECKFDKGTHRITTEYAEGKTKLRAEREVRVVDYREEVVGLFNSVAGFFREMGIDTGGDFAPREIQREAEKKVEGIDRKALDELVGIFETANYSTHEIGRKEYERAYLSSQSVLRSAGGLA